MPAMPQNFSVQSLDHVELFVPDRYEAAKWYQEVLGLSIVPEYQDWASEARGPLMISSDGGRTKLALFTGAPPGSRRDTIGFHRVAFRVAGETFLTFVARLVAVPVFNEAGLQVTAQNIIDHDKAFSIYFCDPFGHRLEVTTYDYEEVVPRLQ